MNPNADTVARARAIGAAYADEVHKGHAGTMLELSTRAMTELPRQPNSPVTHEATVVMLALAAFDIRMGELERA